jgi:transposase
MTSELINFYRECESIKECARKFHCSEKKARRLLITAGEYNTPLSNQINDLYSQGLSCMEISEKLGMRAKTVQDYLPYTKGQYLAENPTENAIRIRACRKRKSEGS